MRRDNRGQCRTQLLSIKSPAHCDQDSDQQSTSRFLSSHDLEDLGAFSSDQADGEKHQGGTGVTVVGHLEGRIVDEWETALDEKRVVRRSNGTTQTEYDADTDGCGGREI